MARLYASYKDGNQVRFVPLAVTLDADGLGVLKVDTELSVDALTLNIDNLKVASTDGTVGNAKYIKVDADGTIHITGLITGDVEVVQDTYADLKNQGKLVNVAEAIINPATEDKQDDVITKLTLGVPKHYNGTANLIKATITFAGTTKHVQIENMDAAKILYISFDAGTKWRTIQPGYIVDLDCAVASLDIKASADGCLYEILSIE